MILNVEKIHAIIFQWLVMVSLDNTKIHHVALQIILSTHFFYIQTLILVIHNEH